MHHTRLLNAEKNYTMKKKIKKVERVRGRVKADKNSHADKKTANINKDEERALIFLPVADQDESLRMTVFSNLFGSCILTEPPAYK